MQVAIISPYRTVVPHFETELDIAQQHLDAGDDVKFFHCAGELANCEFNPDKNHAICQQCRGRRRMGLELLTSDGPAAADGATQSSCFVSLEQPGSLKMEFDSVDDLIAYRIDNFDIGYAVLSSLVSYCRDPEPDLQQYRGLIQRLVSTAWQVYQQTIIFLQHVQPDRVYIYNGRFAGLRGILRACEAIGVDCYLHERGCDGQHYELLKNHLPHDLNAIESAIERSWLAGADHPEQRRKIAASWFHDRVNRVEKVWHSFTKNQQLGRLPAGWDVAFKNISIFCSSDDEFVAIGDAWKNELYPNQVDAIEQIACDLHQYQPATQVYLRMHPNLSGIDNARCQRMRELDIPNLTVIPPEATIDTYQLVRDSNTVVSFGSSVGSEALFWGTPSVLLGPCYYQNLGGVYRSQSHQQTIDLLMDDLTPGDPLGALKYGYWFQTRGVPHQYFQAVGLFEGTFKGQVLYDRPPAKLPRWQRWIGKTASATSLGQSLEIDGIVARTANVREGRDP